MMAEFTREHVWPVSLFTFEAGKMLVRDTTHRLSALSIDYGMVGRRMAMLRTAGGLAYLAFCPDNERKVDPRPARAVGRSRTISRRARIERAE